MLCPIYFKMTEPIVIRFFVSKMKYDTFLDRSILVPVLHGYRDKEVFFHILLEVYLPLSLLHIYLNS